MEDLKKWLWEAVKAGLRLAAFVFVTVALDALTQTVAGLSLKDDSKTILVLVLAVADKFVHEWGKAVEKPGWLGTKGLTGF